MCFLTCSWPQVYGIFLKLAWSETTVGAFGWELLKTLKINTISDAPCLLKITQLTPRNEHTVAAPSEKHLSVLNAKNTVSLNFAFSSTSQIFTFNISAYSVTLFSFTSGRHAHKFEIFTITVTTLHLQLISIFNHYGPRLFCHPLEGATCVISIHQGAPLF